MYKIVPATDLIFKLINCNKTENHVQSALFLYLFNYLILALLIAFILPVGIYYLFLSNENQLPFLYSISIFYPFLFFGIVYYFYKKYFLSIELYKFAVQYFDKSLNHIGNAENTFLSSYMINFLCIETAIFDGETVTKMVQKPENYGLLRKKVLRVWNKSKSPNVPFQTEEYSIVLFLMNHILDKDEKIETTFRKLYVQSQRD